jgi:hypothetical protein
MATTTIRSDIPSRTPLIENMSDQSVRYAKKLNKSNGGTGVPMVYIDGPKVFGQIGGRLTTELLSNDTPQARRNELLEQLPSIRTNFHLQPPEDQKYPSANGKLPLFIKLPMNQISHAHAFDTKIKHDIADLTPSWFQGKSMSPEMIENVYLPLVRQYPQTAEVPENEKDTCVKVAIFSGPAARDEVEVLVQEPDNLQNFRVGSIHDLQRGAPIIFVFQYTGLWFNNKGTEVGPNFTAPRILVLHQPSNAAVPTFNVEPGVEFTIIQPFLPPTQDADEPAADTMEIIQPTDNTTTEQTIIAGGGGSAYPNF